MPKEKKPIKGNVFSFRLTDRDLLALKRISGSQGLIPSEFARRKILQVIKNENAVQKAADRLTDP